MIINIRGTGGSGKSTVVRRIMELYSVKEPVFIAGRRQPIRYFLHNRAPVLHADGTRPIPHLVVPGHYETPTGGCDTISTVDDVFEILDAAVKAQFDVIYEGIISQDSTSRIIEFANKIGRENFAAILLNTPVEECLKGIQARRDERGDTRPLNPKNTINRAKSAKAGASRLKDAGITVYTLDREAAFLKAKELLGWPNV